jgi:hypothetical protein
MTNRQTQMTRCVLLLGVLASPLLINPDSATAQYDEGGYSYYCDQPWSTTFTATGYHQGKTYSSVSWDQFGGVFYTDGVPSSWYKSTGNIAPNLTVDNTRKWQWLDGRADFTCKHIHVIPGVLVIEDWYAWRTSGSVVPYGEDEATDTLPGSGLPPGMGGNQENQTELFICWYYLYPDGTRSEYFRCEQL